MSSNNFGFTQIDVQRTEFTWKIDNFQCLSYCLSTGYYLESPTFTVRPDDNLKWKLYLWPNGYSNDYRNHVSTALSCTSTSNCNIHVKFSICIINNNGVKCYEKCQTVDSISNSSSRFSDFLEKKVLNCEPSTILLNEVLTVYCELTVVNKNSLVTVDESIHRQPIVLQANAILNALEEQLEKQEFSDVTLVASCGKELPAHKFVLAARSPVFLAMFTNDMKEMTENSVVIKDLDYDSIKEMLRFMYVGKVENFDNVSGGILEAQDKYQIDGLKELWEEHFFANINVDNVLDLLALSIRYEIDKIQFLAEKFIRCHAKSIIDSAAFKAIDEPDFLAKVVRILAHV